MFAQACRSFRKNGHRAARTRRTSASLSAPLTRAADLAGGSEDLSEKDAQDRRQAMMTTLTLSTFDNEDDEFSSN